MLGCADSETLVHTEVRHACLQLVGLSQAVNPVFVDFNKLLDASEQFLFIKSGHVQVLAGIFEGLQMVVHSKSLHLSAVPVLDHTNTLVNRDTVVEGGGGCLNLNGAVGNNFGSLPPTSAIPVNLNHMVCEVLSESKGPWGDRLNFSDFHWIDLQVASLKSFSYRDFSFSREIPTCDKFSGYHILI